jgi:hypothetical protein
MIDIEKILAQREAFRAASSIPFDELSEEQSDALEAYRLAMEEHFEPLLDLAAALVQYRRAYPSVETLRGMCDSTKRIALFELIDKHVRAGT